MMMMVRDNNGKWNGFAIKSIMEVSVARLCNTERGYVISVDALETRTHSGRVYSADMPGGG